MLGHNLVRLIEKHSEELAAELTNKIFQAQRTPTFKKIPRADLQRAASEVYSRIGEWLLTKTESDVEFRFTELGKQRAQQGIPLNEIIWALVMSKEELIVFLQREATIERAVELYGELELLQLLNHFYDQAIFFVAVGYQRKETAVAA